MESAFAEHADTGDTSLGRAIARRAEAHAGKSGIYPLADARDAFAARMLLARAAERSLDVQYYIWEKDMSGRLLFEALHEAAGRGVRVRLLLDDLNTAGLDALLAALDAHPNIEVRLFNPLRIRWPRWVGYVTDFSRLNRRMHNKSFTADRQATIIGGRNVGDEYFDAEEEGLTFVDLDLLAVGRVVRDVAEDFERYWTCASSCPAHRLLRRADGPLRLSGHGPQAARYLEAVRRSPFVDDLLQGRLELEWAHAQLVSDDPAKALGRAEGGKLLPEQLKALLGDPGHRLQLVSAYFVPATAGTASLVDMAKRGVEVRILTNAFEATDVAPVHAGYAKRRRALLAAGVTLYELRRLGPSRKERTAGTFRGSSGSAGSSASSLHAKIFSVDEARVFVGSFNFDPRSARLNTEMGLLIDSAALAQRIEDAFEHAIPQRSYEPRLSQAGKLDWIERRDGREIRHDVEPGTTFLKRAAVRLLGVLPIEWLL